MVVNPFAGNWTGTITGLSNTTLQLWIKPSGGVSADHGTGTSSGPLIGIGTVDLQGNITWTGGAGTTAPADDYTGTLHKNGSTITGSGIWSGVDGSGTWSVP